MGRYEADYTHHRVRVHGLPFTPKEYVLDGEARPLLPEHFIQGVVELNLERKFEELVLR